MELFKVFVDLVKAVAWPTAGIRSRFYVWIRRASTFPPIEKDRSDWSRVRPIAPSAICRDPMKSAGWQHSGLKAPVKGPLQLAATSITVRMHPDVRRERRILPVSLASDIVKAGRIRVSFSELPRLLRRQWSMHPDIESALNEVARHTRRAITEPAHFASRPWTQADDDKLRRFAVTGLSS